jgi:RNA polymerase sigma-70 factor (ECF subfamily)
MEPLVARRAEGIAQRPGYRAEDVDQLDGAELVFLSTRRRLFGIAYRVLRDPFEAEDIVQDTWLRWRAADRASVLNAEAFLVTTTTRLALNDAQSARHRHEMPAGPWLPHLATPDTGPESGAERGERVDDAVLLLLAKLTPVERAVYVLREAFDYPYGRIADRLQLSEANCRQLMRRARRSMASERRRPVSLTAHKRLLDAFLAAARGGNVADLEDLLVGGAAPACAAGVGSGDDDPAAA